MEKTCYSQVLASSSELQVIPSCHMPRWIYTQASTIKEILEDALVLSSWGLYFLFLQTLIIPWAQRKKWTFSSHYLKIPVFQNLRIKKWNQKEIGEEQMPEISHLQKGAATIYTFPRTEEKAATTKHSSVVPESPDAWKVLSSSRAGISLISKLGHYQAQVDSHSPGRQRSHQPKA